MVEPQALQVENSGIDPDSQNLIIKLLRSPRPCSILIHGEPGTGKKQLARSLAACSGRQGVFLLPDESLEDDTTICPAKISMVFQKTAPEDILIVDKAEPYLDASFNGLFGESLDRNRKTFVNNLLDRNRLHVIWIARDIKNIHESTKSRFNFLIKIPKPGIHRRQTQWNDHFRRSGMYMEPEILDNLGKKLAGQYELNPALMERSISTVQNLDQISKTSFDKVIGGFLEAGLGRVMKHEGSQAWSLEALNCTPSSKQLLDLCSREETRTHRMLFHGAPGTGKSELVHQLAKLIDHEVVQIQASDILSKWQGETEANIRSCFAQAERPRTIVLVDEIDSFLAKRDRMETSWSISQVNEFLTAMDNFRGFLVGTTNGLNRLDPAVIRRFSIKVSFDYLTRQGCEILKESYFPEFTASLEWSALPPLCPSDFGLAASSFFRPKSLEELSAFLKNEAQLRNDSHFGRRLMGFAP